jgi:hypothetical protein
MQGEYWGVCSRVSSLGCGVRDVELDPFHVEDAAACAVVAPKIFLVAVEAESEAAAFLLFLPGEAAPMLSIHAELGGTGRRHRHGQERWRLTRCGTGRATQYADRVATEAGIGRANSINSTCRARLIAADNVSVLWIRTAWLSGDSSPPVKSGMRWFSSRHPARGKRAWNRLAYSSTVLVRRHSASSNRGAERNGGPNYRLRRSLKLPHGGVPSSSWSCMNQSWATSSRLYGAIQTRSSGMVRCWRKYDLHMLRKSMGSDLPS